MLIAKSKKRFILLYLFLFSIAIPVCAQQSMTLQRLIDSAQSHLPLLMQKKALLEASKAEITDARHASLPVTKLGEQLTFSSANSLPGTIFSLGIVPPTAGSIRTANTMQAATGNLAVIYNEYELVNFGLTSARIKAATANAGVKEGDLNRELYLLRYQLSRLYFTTLKYKIQLGADKQNVERYSSLFTVTKALTGSGLKPGADSSQALAELSKARAAYTQTQGKYDQLQQQLSYLSGLAAEDINIDTSYNNLNQAPVSLLSSLPADTAGNPLVDFYKRQKAYYSANEFLINKSYQPKILLLGGLEARGSSIAPSNDYKSLDDGLSYSRYNYAVGLAFVYPIFDIVHRKDKVTINHLRTVASDYELQQQQMDIDELNKQAEISIHVAETNLKELPNQLTAARDVFTQKMAQYRAGIINLVDLTNASFVLYRSQTDYIETLGDWYLAQLDKAVATNNLTQFIQAIK